MLSKNSTESETHIAMTATMVHGMITMLDGLLLIKHKFLMLPIQVMVLSSLHTLTSSLHLTISKSIIFMMIIIEQLMMSLVILVLKEHLLSQQLELKKSSFQLTFITQECIHQHASIPLPKVTFNSTKVLP